MRSRILFDASLPSILGIPRSITISRYARKLHLHSLLRASLYFSTAIWPSSAFSICMSKLFLSSSCSGMMLYSLSSTTRIRAVHPHGFADICRTSILLEGNTSTYFFSSSSGTASCSFLPNRSTEDSLDRSNGNRMFLKSFTSMFITSPPALSSSEDDDSFFMVPLPSMSISF